jgi:hypothetical protein
MKYAINPINPPNLCLNCNEQVRRPKRFCDDRCNAQFGYGTVIDQRGTAQVQAARQQHGVTAEALEWKRKRNVQQSF